MSWETEQHVRLVETLAAEIRARHGGLYSLTLFVDLPSFRRDRPRVIGGFVPDVFAVDAPETCRIIGEAKTPIDLETDRSRAQIEAFLGHLSRFPNSNFYLAVPLLYRNRAETLLGSAISNLAAPTVRVDVIGSG
jgi:hypothetical protein